MFDRQKLKQLQQKSHNRGLLSKQFYHQEQVELQRKRRSMKEELDRQVEQRRRKKEHDKLQQQRKMKKEEEDINIYYQNLENREKKISINESLGHNMKNNSQPYQTYPNESHSDSKVKGQPHRNRASSKANLTFQGDIPLLPVMPPESTSSSYPASYGTQPVLSNSKSKVNAAFSSGATPVLDLSEQQQYSHAIKVKKPKKSIRERTLQAQRQSKIQKIQNSRHKANPSQRFGHERQSTLPDEQSIIGSIVRGGGNSLQKREAENQSEIKEIYEVQQQNTSLKVELKKNQEAISLLMGAVRSNAKLQKYRVQAEKILTGNNMQSSLASKREEEKREQGLMLPRINHKHQSIMHDYLLSAARRAKKSLGK